MKTKLLIIILLSGTSVFADPAFFGDPNHCDQIIKKPQKSHAHEALSGHEYYDAALKGELLDRGNDFERSWTDYSNNIYQDSEGNLWQGECFSNESCQEDNKELLVNKYLASKLMNLLVRSWSAEVRLVNYHDGCIAGKTLTRAFS